MPSDKQDQQRDIKEAIEFMYSKVCKARFDSNLKEMCRRFESLETESYRKHELIFESLEFIKKRLFIGNGEPPLDKQIMLNREDIKHQEKRWKYIMAMGTTLSIAIMSKVGYDIALHMLNNP